jgi:hypothetical protein
MAILAWMTFILAAFMLIRGHENPIISLVSILLAFAAVVPKKELEQKQVSNALRMADFLATAYLIAFLALSALGLAYTLLNLAGLI